MLGMEFIAEEGLSLCSGEDCKGLSGKIGWRDGGIAFDINI